MSERPRERISERRMRAILAQLSQKYDFASSALGTIDFNSAKIKKVLARPEFAVFVELLPKTQEELVEWEIENPQRIKKLEAATKLLFAELGIKGSE